MLLPTTASTVWILAIVGLLCLGSWANTLKLAGRWRFEFFYFDFVLGMLVCAGIAAFALGSARPQELTFQDNLLLVGYRRMAWALGSGIVFNLGAMLLLASVTLSGLSVAFPLTLGVALIVGAIWDYANAPQTSMALAFGGIVLFAVAVVVTALAHVWRLQHQQQAAQTALQPDPRVKSKRTRSPGGALAIVLGVIGGLAMGVFPRVLSEATAAEGLAPYSAVLFLSAAALLSSPFFVLFFTTFPVAATAGSPGGYFSGGKKQHLLGLAGGILWATGMLSSLLAAGAPRDAQPGGLVQYTLNNGVLVVAAAWGLLIWGEFREAGVRARMLAAVMLVLFLAGLGVTGFAFSAK